LYIPIYFQTYWWYNYPPVGPSDTIVRFIRGCVDEDGGIGNYQDATSYLETVFYAISSFIFLNRASEIPSKTIQYILDKQSASGGFGETSEYANLFNTFYAIMCLSNTGGINTDIKRKTSKYLDHIRQNNFSDHGVGTANVTQLYWYVLISNCLKRDISIEKDRILQFIDDCFDENEKLFAVIPHGEPTLQNTFEAITVYKELFSLNKLDIDVISGAILKKKAGRQFYDDMFHEATLSSTMWAMGGLNILDKLSLYDHVDVLHYAIEKAKSSNSLFDIYCCIMIITSLIYSPGLINDTSQILLEDSNNKITERIYQLNQRIERSGYDKSLVDYRGLLDVSQFSALKGMSFLQIILSKEFSRFYEIERYGDGVLAMYYPMTRMVRECITPRSFKITKVKLRGVFSSGGDLENVAYEQEVLDDYCRQNNIINYFPYNDITEEELMSVLAEDTTIFYYSGHSAEGSLQLRNSKIEIGKVLDSLIASGCSIAILNCCDTYEYVKQYFLDNPTLNDSLNVVCTISEVIDKQAILFIKYFLYYLELSLPISEALRLTRHDLYVELGGLGDTWYSYLLFGNPFTIAFFG
jgi:prenyltransferase beta subunit